MFHLGFFSAGFRVPAWNQPWSGTSSRDWSDGMFYVDLARAFERACFDYFMIEDSNYIPDDYGGSMEVYLKLGHRAPKHDPAILAAQISQHTKSIGIVVTVATSETTPFHLARSISSLDHLSHGRIGWNMATGSSDHAAQNFGHEGQLPHDERYDVADEFVGLVTTAQDRPVLCQAGVSPRGLKFTARHSDTVIATANGLDGMKAVRECGRLAGMSMRSVTAWSQHCKHADWCARRTSSRPSARTCTRSDRRCPQASRRGVVRRVVAPMPMLRR